MLAKWVVTRLIFTRFWLTIVPLNINKRATLHALDRRKNHGEAFDGVGANRFRRCPRLHAAHERTDKTPCPPTLSGSSPGGTSTSDGVSKTVVSETPALYQEAEDF